MIYKVVCPLYITLPRKTKKDKKIYLNLNVNRNLHHAINNQAKIVFKDFIMDQLILLPKFKGNIEVKYTVIKQDKRHFDLSNVACVIDKFLCDALVEAGKLVDDNTKYLKRVEYVYGGIDKNNGRCIVEIKEVCDD